MPSSLRVEFILKFHSSSYHNLMLLFAITMTQQYTDIKFQNRSRKKASKSIILIRLFVLRFDQLVRYFIFFTTNSDKSVIVS